MRQRPTRPLPSPNGWMISNCAWAIAACATGERSSRFMKRQRSRRSGSTCSCGGPTYSASAGEVPPIQLGSVRIWPAIRSSGGTIAISRWIARIVSMSSGAEPAPIAIARSSALIAATISRAR